MGERLPLGFLINTLGHEFRAKSTEAVEPFGLSTREFGLMLRLGNNGALSQGRLGELHHTDRTSMVAYMDGLESKGFVERHRDPADRRAYVISLTDLGRSTLADARKMIEEAECEITSSLTDRQREEVRMLLTRVVDDLQT